MFPVEIWENILQKTDALTLSRLRTVNSTWNEIVTKHLQKSDAWYKQCIDDIPKKYWPTLLENSFHLFTLEKQWQNNEEYDRYDSSIWTTLYRAWVKWKNVHSYDKCVTEEFNPLPKHRVEERITCCSTLGELVAVGSSMGYIRIYNLRTNKSVFVVDQYDQVKSVKLWVQGKNYNKIILIATSIYKMVRIWDIIEPNKVLIKRLGSVICAGHSYYCIGLPGKTIIVQNVSSGKKFSLTLPISETSTRRNWMGQWIPKNLYPIKMIINQNELFCVYNYGYFCEIDLKGSESNGFCRPQIMQQLISRHQRIVNYYLFNPQVVFCITVQGHLGVSVYKSEWKFFYVFQFLEGSISAMLFHFSLLVIGLDYGAICLYSVKDPLELKNLNWQNAKKIQVSDEPIVSVNIMEISGDQRLLITTNHTVYNIKLDYA